MTYIAFVTKGLENISVEELSGINGVQILKSGQKFIHFNYEGDPKRLALLKTVDDIGILVCEEKFSPSELFSIDILTNAIKLIRNFRDISDTFSVTLSVYKNELDRDQFQSNMVTYIQEKLGLKYTPLDHTNLDLRINIEEAEIFVSVKLFPNSLYKRDYDHKTKLGALRSTIAAAMLHKLYANKGVKMVDNFCGSGTFLCEAASMGCDVYGGDIDPRAVALTKKNLESLQVPNVRIFVQDATKTTWPNNTFDIAVANFPWDKQIKVDKLSELFDGALKEYARILKPTGKCAFISTNPTLLMKYIKKHLAVKNIEEFKIGYLGQTPTIQIIKL